MNVYKKKGFSFVVSCIVFALSLSTLNSKYYNCQKKRDVTPGEEKTTLEITSFQQEQTKSALAFSKNIPTLDFSNLPLELELIITNTSNIISTFTSEELVTIQSLDADARVTLLINKDSLMRRYISTITFYLMNECAKVFFDVTGTYYIDLWLIEEGIVSPNSNTLYTTDLFADCNSRIFNLFIGLQEIDALTTPQQTLKDGLYDAVNNEPDAALSVASRKNYRRIHPILNLPQNLPAS